MDMRLLPEAARVQVSGKGKAMSMLGEQIKELHEMADAMHRRSREIGLDYGMCRGLDDASRMLRDAADTIWQLRDDLQQANDAARDAEHNESMAWDRVRKAESENAKLRELCADMYKRMDVSCQSGCAIPVSTMAHIKNRVIGLGIKVDG